MKTTDNFQTFAEEINVILDLLTTFEDEHITIVREKPVKADKITASKAILRIYDRDNVDVRADGDRYETKLIARCAFYPHHIYPTRLGSVAIYGDRIAAWERSIRLTGELFGRTVTDISIVMGRRPFLDIRLGARVHHPWTKAFYKSLMPLRAAYHEVEYKRQ